MTDKSLDDGFKEKGVFPDISKAFGKVWHGFDLQTKTKWNIRKAFKYNKRFLRFKKT